MIDLIYREAIVGDAENISNLIIDSQKAFCFHEYTDDGKKLMVRLCGPAAIRSYIERGDIYYVAVYGDLLIGVAGVRDNEHLSHNFVYKDWHRQGISNRLWELVSAKCVRRGNCGSFNLNASTYAIPVYEKWGFRITGSKRHQYGLAFTPMELNP